MVATTTAISIDEYLRTSYEYDQEYVDGEPVERAMPTYPHARLIVAICAYVFAHQKKWGLETLSEMRLRVAPGRVRVPDLCATLRQKPDNPRALGIPPLFVVEVLSPEDSLTKVREKGRDYLHMGVRYVWTVDPESGECYQHAENGMSLIPDQTLRVPDTEIMIPVAEILMEIV